MERETGGKGDSSAEHYEISIELPLRKRHLAKEEGDRMTESKPSTPSETTQAMGSSASDPTDQPPPLEDHQQTNQGAAAQTVSPPYGMFVALVALGLISIIAL